MCRARGVPGRTSLGAVWETHLAPLLARAPDLTGLTLLEYLEDTFPGEYDGRILRTLQRRVQHWKAVHGPDKGDSPFVLLEYALYRQNTLCF